MPTTYIKIGEKTSHATTPRLVEDGFRGGKTPRKAIIRSMADVLLPPRPQYYIYYFHVKS